MKKNKDDIIAIRRSQLTNAAYKVVAKKGYYDFTIKDIAKEAGLSTGLVHYYFKNKEDLLLNLLKEMNKTMTLYLHKATIKSKSPAEKLKIFMTQAFDLILQEGDYFYIIIDFLTQVNRNERMKNANKKLFKSYRDECEKIIEEGVKAKVFKEMDIRYTSTIIISIVQGLIIQYAIDDKAFDYKKYSKNVSKFINNLVLKT